MEQRCDSQTVWTQYQASVDSLQFGLFLYSAVHNSRPQAALHGCVVILSRVIYAP